MAEYESPLVPGMPGSTSIAQETGLGWAVGLTAFAAMMMVIIGTFQFIEGMAAILNDDFFPPLKEYSLKIDVTAWGWLHLIGGFAIMLAGVWLMLGSVLARIVAIIVSLVVAIYSFYSIPYYPVWSFLILGLSIAVIWAVCSYGNFINSGPEPKAE